MHRPSGIRPLIAPPPDAATGHDALAHVTSLRSIATIVLVAAAFMVVWRAWAVVEALIVGAVLAAALWPWISRLSSIRMPGGWRLPRFAAVALVYVVTFATLGALVWLAVTGLIPVAERIVADHPGPTTEIRRWLDAVRAPTIEEGARRALEEATAPVDPSGAAVGVIGGALHSTLVLLFTFLLLVSGDRIAGWLFMILPRDRRANARATALRIRDRMSNWVLGWLAYGAMNGLIVLVAMTALGVPSPWTWAVLGLVFALMPGLGPALVYVPAIVLSLGDPWRASALLGAAGLQHVLDVFLLAPRVLAGELKLPPIVTLAAVMVATALFGFWGALIAVPVVVAVQQVLREGVGSASAQPRREGALDPEADERDAHHRRGDEEAGRQDPPDPRLGHERAARLRVEEDGAPRLLDGVAQAEEGERGLQQDRAARELDELRERERDDRREDAEAQDARVAGAERPRR